MSSRRDQILDAIVTALQGVGLPAGLVVHRFRTQKIGADGLPEQVVYPEAEETQVGPGRGVATSYARKAKRKLLVVIEHRVDAGSDTPDGALDPLLTWAVKKCAADPTWGGLAYDTTEMHTEWTAAEQDAVYGAAKTRFLVEYVTDAADPDSLT